MQQYVIYKRVSTKEQGRSGLGLAAQDRDIGIYLENTSNIPFEVVGEFTDILSGKDDARPQLEEALALVRRTGAELLVSKLDRLSRSVAFIAGLMEDKKVRLRVASMPRAAPFELHIYAALAQQEREFISIRTKAALAEAKKKRRAAKLPPLGGLRDKTMKRNKAVQVNAAKRAARVADTIIPLREAGKTLREIAEALNKSGVQTARGGRWHAAQVQRTLSRLV